MADNSFKYLKLTISHHHKHGQSIAIYQLVKGFHLRVMFPDNHRQKSTMKMTGSSNYFAELYPDLVQQQLLECADAAAPFVAGTLEVWTTKSAAHPFCDMDGHTR